MDIKLQTLNLFKRYEQATTERHKQHLVNQICRLNQGLVQKIAHRFAKQCRELYEDLEQVGYLGLMKAVRSFDLSNGAAFSSHACPKIRGEILHYLRDKAEPIRIPRRWLDKQNLVRQLREEGAVDAAIEAKLRWEVGELQQSDRAMQRQPVRSLDVSLADEDDAPKLQIVGHYATVRLMTIEQLLMDANYPLDSNGMFNATALCKMEGKEFAEFWRLPSTQKMVARLQKMGQSQVFEIKRGRKGYALLHKSIAPKFLVWVNASKYEPLIENALLGNLEAMYGTQSVA